MSTTCQKLPARISDLEDRIIDRIRDSTSGVNDDNLKVSAFHQACDAIVEELLQLDHSLKSSDYDSDSRYEFNRQYYLPDFITGDLYGLEVDLTPKNVKIHWLVASSRIKCANCGRPPGDNIQRRCQYCGSDVDGKIICDKP